MPGGDRTGPRGRGPLTGRKRGYCAGYDQPGYMNPEGGYGWHGGRRHRHRWRGGHRFRNKTY